MKITRDYIESLFDYRDGSLYWKESPAKPVPAGSVAGTVANNGYLRIGIKRRYFLAHRLVFLLHHGHMPKYVDHIDGNKQNNRVENLRVATKAQNCQNQKVRSTNTSGIKGVSWHIVRKKWQVNICANGVQKYIGLFNELADAQKAAIEARSANHGEFARYV